MQSSGGMCPFKQTYIKKEEKENLFQCQSLCERILNTTFCSK